MVDKIYWSRNDIKTVNVVCCPFLISSIYGKTDKLQRTDYLLDKTAFGKTKRWMVYSASFLPSAFSEENNHTQKKKKKKKKKNAFFSQFFSQFQKHQAKS